MSGFQLTLVAVVAAFLAFWISRFLDKIIVRHCNDLYQARKTAFKISMAVAVVLFIVGCIGLLNSRPRDMALPLAICFISIVSICVGAWFEIWRASHEHAVKSDYFYFTEHEMVVKRRHPFIGERLQIIDETEMSLEYDPVKVHVAGANFGGAFAGEVFTTGGKTYLASGKQTGKYFLSYREGNDSSTIHSFSRIKLTGEAYEQAKRSRLIAGLGCDPQCLENRGSKEYCQQIKKWLSTAID